MFSSMFCWQTLGPLYAYQSSFECQSPSECWCWPCVFLYGHNLNTLLMAASSMIMHHGTKQKSSQAGFTNITKSSVDLPRRQIWIQSIAFGKKMEQDVGRRTGRDCAEIKLCNHVNPNLKGMFPASCDFTISPKPIYYHKWQCKSYHLRSWNMALFAQMTKIIHGW